MKYRRLPSGLEVSEVGLGLWSLVTDEWGANTDVAEDVIREALRLGINFFDTADVYGRGKGEEVLSKALGPKIDDVAVLTKIGLDFYMCGRIRPNFDVGYLETALSRSLERLNVGYVDILMLHNPTMDVITRREVLNFMRDVKRSGRAKMIGVSLGPTVGWGDEGKAAAAVGYEALEYIFNMIEQLPGLELLRLDGVAHIIRTPHASDVLDEVRWPLKGSERLHRGLKDPSWVEAALRKVNGLSEIARREGLRLYELAIVYILAFKNVHSVVPNMTSVSDLRRFVEAEERGSLREAVVDEVLNYWKANLTDLNTASIEETNRLKAKRMVDRPGLEPGTSAVRGRRSSS